MRKSNADISASQHAPTPPMLFLSTPKVPTLEESASDQQNLTLDEFLSERLLGDTFGFDKTHASSYGDVFILPQQTL